MNEINTQAPTTSVNEEYLIIGAYPEGEEFPTPFDDGTVRDDLKVLDHFSSAEEAVKALTDLKDKGYQLLEVVKVLRRYVQEN